MRIISFAILLSLWMLTARCMADECDVVVYGGTPGGIAAAVAAAKDGCQVILVEPYQRIGGLVTNGLSHTDFRTLEGRTGAYLEFAKRVEAYYVARYGADSPEVRNCFGGAFAEPKINLLIFQQMLAEHPKIQVLVAHRLKSVTTSSAQSGSLNHLNSLQFLRSDGTELEISARVAIDCTYEGDLMAKAGVRWRAGREGTQEYGESLAPSQSDNQLQAYNFRFIMTNDPANRVTPSAPAGYQREDFVGVLDSLQPGKIDRIFDYPSKCIFKAQTPPLPRGKYDINDVSRNVVRLSLPGKNLGWPDGDWPTRQAIFTEHLRDQVGLLYFLQNDPAVPEKYRNEAKQWGWCRDEFEQTNHLPEQLYVREARRMVGRYVYAQRDSEPAPGDARAVLHRDSIAMGDYGNNCHGTAHEGPRFGGKHTGEFYNSVPPYQIPYFVMVPREVDNLLVPTAASSSHVGFCALRLEPIWMVLGQAAGYAAAMTTREGRGVHNVDVRLLQQRLHAAGAATIYMSDVLPGHPDFATVQWWGNHGGWHGLHATPAKPGERGRNLHGQYYEAYPYHSADLEAVLDERTAKHWQTVATTAGIPQSKIPSIKIGASTCGQFLRELSKNITESSR